MHAIAWPASAPAYRQARQEITCRLAQIFYFELCWGATNPVATAWRRFCADFLAGVGKAINPRGIARVLKSDGTKATPDTDTEKALKTAFLNQLDVVDKMADLEDKLGIIAPGEHKQIDVLIRLAGASSKRN
jgi:hypothetical protein